MRKGRHLKLVLTGQIYKNMENITFRAVYIIVFGIFEL